MASAIDPTRPADGVPAEKADLRGNLQAAKDEIEALQDAMPAGAVVGTSDPQTLTNKTLSAPTGTRAWLTGVAGLLDAATHGFKGIVTAGDVTVPTTPGFSCLIEAGGPHTVSFNGLTSAPMAAGHIMAVEVRSETVIKATLVTSFVEFS